MFIGSGGDRSREDQTSCGTIKNSGIYGDNRTIFLGKTRKVGS